MSANRSRPGRLADRAVIALLLVGMGLPLVGTWLGLDLMPEGNELRHLAEYPHLQWTRASLRTFPERYEDYFNDHFGFRGPLIQAHCFAMVRGLGASTAASVMLGNDNWLYFTNQPPGSDHDEARPFTQEELARWARVLERRKEWLARRHCLYLVFIPPDKQTIYPEHVNPNLRARHASGRLDQLLEYLAAHSTVKIVDVRDTLRRAREQEVLYHSTDSHWNARGAFLGYEALMQVLSQWFPEMKPRRRSQFDEVVVTGPGGDLAGMLDLREVYREDYVRLIPRIPLRAQLSPFPVEPPRGVKMDWGPPGAIENPDTSLPRAVVFHDSFALGFLYLLGEHFHRMVTVWNDGFHQDMVEREHPDVVIHELLERKLGTVGPIDITDDY
jgi:hypothetical protein